MALHHHKDGKDGHFGGFHMGGALKHHGHHSLIKHKGKKTKGMSSGHHLMLTPANVAKLGHKPDGKGGHDGQHTKMRHGR